MTPFKGKSVLGSALKYLVLTAFAFVVVVVVMYFIPTRVPKDKELIASFHAHRGTFEQLHAMAVKDMQNGWYIHWLQEDWWCLGRWWCLASSKPSGMPASRWEDYKDLISQIRPKVDGVNIDYNGSMYFGFAGGRTGLAPEPRWSKGIGYIPPGVKRWEALLPDLDGAHKLPANVYIREIEPNWFILYSPSDE
jgi:hypothetical protein